MKRLNCFIVLVTTLLVLILSVTFVTAQPVNASPPLPTYTGLMYPCKQYFSEGTKYIESGNTIHARNLGQISYGGSEYMGYGPQFENLNWNINLETFEGTFWGTSTHEIYDEAGNYFGAWVGSSEGKMHGEFIAKDDEIILVWLGEGKSVFEGQDGYEGLRIKSVWVQEPYFDQPGPGCEDYLPGPFEGPVQPVVSVTNNYIIETTGTWPPDV